MLVQRGLGGGELSEVVAAVVVAPRAAATRGAVLLAEAVVLGEGGRFLAALLATFLPALLRARLGVSLGRGAVNGRRRGIVGRAQVGTLEEWILGEVALQLLVELDRAQLQESDRLLELRREREVLR